MERQKNQVQTLKELTTRSLSLAQAGETLGVSRRTLYYWIKRGRLQTRRTSMGSQRVLLESLKARWVQRH